LFAYHTKCGAPGDKSRSASQVLRLQCLPGNMFDS
jgi:hypothetical protein